MCIRDSSYTQYEDGGQTYRILTMLECVGTKEISTPRGIHVGSTKAEVVGVYGMDLVYCVKQEYGELLTCLLYTSSSWCGGAAPHASPAPCPAAGDGRPS